MKIIKAPTTKEASALELKNRALARRPPRRALFFSKMTAPCP
jgi:hypothetical protein